MNKICVFCKKDIPELNEYYRHVNNMHQDALKKVIDDCYGD